MNFGNTNFQFYSHSQICKAEQTLCLSKKRGSTTAYKALLLPINVHKRWCYWNLPFPGGIANIRRTDMIDLDEFGVFVQTANRKDGKAFIGIRVNEPGPYEKGEKRTTIMAISGDPAGERWRDTWVEGGTTNDRMVGFIRTILNSIGPGTPARRRCFTMDNLNSHHNALVTQLIYNAGHKLAFRAPYYAVDGPIEYVFNTLQNYLRINLPRITDNESLLHELDNAIASIYNFERYFIHCGFWRI